MDFTNSEQVKLIAAFDNWYDMKNVVTTFKHMGYTCDETPEEYVAQIQKLQAAMFSYPELSLHEAYMQYLKEPKKINFPSRGLGDTVYKITHTTGLDKLAEMYTKITGKDCGCKNRQEALNKLVPYGVKEI